MKLQTPILCTAMLAGFSLMTSGPALASPGNGVQCPAGYDAQLSANNSRLHCQRDAQVQRDSVCSPVTVGSRSGRIGANVNLRRVVVLGGPDRCTDPTGRTDGGAPQMALLPGDPSTGWTRAERRNGEDIFVRAGTPEFAFPTGALFNPTHNPANGVSCPRGYTGTARNRGLVCAQAVESKRANCDFGWSLSVDHNRGREDRCLGVNIGNSVPDGVTNVQLQAQRAYWTLDVRNGRDQWVRRDYKYISR